MKNIVYLFFSTMVISLFFFSCSGDDPLTQEVVNSAPARFTTTVTDRQRKSVSVSWSESIDPEGKAVVYSVYKNNVLLAKDLTQRSFVFKNLPINQSFFVTVRAIDEDGQSQVSQVLEVKVLPSKPPTDFQVFNEVKFVREGYGYFAQEISWTSSSDPDGGSIVYDIVADIPPRENISLINNLTELSYRIRISDLAQAKVNTVYVIARDEDGMTRTVSNSFYLKCYNEVCPY